MVLELFVLEVLLSLALVLALMAVLVLVIVFVLVLVPLCCLPAFLVAGRRLPETTEMAKLLPGMAPC